jgi:hypothetical protein
MAIIFNKGDKDYFKWMDLNPNGFILNTGKGINTSVFVLHSSGCSHLTEYNSLDEYAYTMRNYIKIASLVVSNIEKYCSTNKTQFRGHFKICESCNPEYEKYRITYPDDIEVEVKEFVEGATKSVLVNFYERNPKAREKCIEIYGCICQCCNINFEEIYGEIGIGFIHVHHKKLISEIGKEYKVDPQNDLIPLCPNCHAMIHKATPPFSLEELKLKINIVANE